jgi:hypothetical protein
VPPETTAQLAPDLDTPEAVEAFVSALYRKVCHAHTHAWDGVRRSSASGRMTDRFLIQCAAVGPQAERANMSDSAAFAFGMIVNTVEVHPGQG